MDFTSTCDASTQHVGSLVSWLLFMDRSPKTRRSLLLRVRDPMDHRAWSEFVEIYSPLIYGFLRRHGLQDADAADVTQDVLRAVATAVRKLDYDSQRGSFRGWLFTVIRSKLRSHYVRRREPNRGSGDTRVQRLLQQQAAPEPDDTDWDSDYEQRLLTWAMEKVRDDVSETTWEAFRQTAIENRPPKEVAGDLGMTVAAVYLAKSRFIHRVRGCVSQLEDG